MRPDPNVDTGGVRELPALDVRLLLGSGVRAIAASGCAVPGVAMRAGCRGGGGVRRVAENASGGRCRGSGLCLSGSRGALCPSDGRSVLASQGGCSELGTNLGLSLIHI